MIKKIAIVTTHPIQYNAPWFKLLNNELYIGLHVFYTWSQSQNSVTDHTFGKEIKWDLPLLDGYDYTFVENVAKNPGTHHRLGINCPDLLTKIQDFNPNVILVFGWYLKSHLDVIKYFNNKVPIWFRGDSTLIDDLGSIKAFLRKIYLSYVYKKINRALYVGQNNKRYFLEYGVKEKDLIFANHAIDNNRFYDNHKVNYEDSAIKLRRDLGCKNEDIVILYSGKFQDKKQPLFLVRAFINANARLEQKLKLLLVGNGPQESELVTIAKQNNDIHILPFQNQSRMPIIYRVGNIFCLPSKGPGETWGLAVNEAMACSRPIIVSDRVGCAVDLVTDKNGFVFHYNSTEELENIFLNLKEYNLKNMGARSKNIVANWNFKNIVNAIKLNLIPK